ncbi:hypothetical protein EV127DRAFT_491556 [Xylaria flabelliformis]|nr:hypothetical protein EV127DRAFT_491556 [Xylaria flabelliformis]
MAQRLTEQVKLLFASQPRHVFERIAGQGGSGIALCFQDKEAGPDEFSRFIVKTVLLGNDIEITNEKKWLERLRWAEHIVTPITLDPDPLTAFAKPSLVIEYLENGTIDALLQKRRAAGLGRLPNRVLWAIFLCLVRACLAMAIPPPPIPNPRTPKDKRRETLPADADAQILQDLIHSDMNLGNLMFGDDISQDQPPDTEHHLVPILKLIDFGDAYEVEGPEAEPPRKTYDETLHLFARMRNDLGRLRDIGKPTNDRRDGLRNDATDMNILEIGVVMGRLMTNDLTNPRAGVMREIILELHEDMEETVRSNLDIDLFWLVARCLACNAFLRPRLSHLLDLLEYYTANKAYANMVDESDLSIKQMIQRYIFDADGPAAAAMADNAIVLSPGSVADNVPIASLGDNPGNPIGLDMDPLADDGSNISIEGDANHPIEISPDSSMEEVSIANVDGSIASPVALNPKPPLPQNYPSRSPSSQGSPPQGSAANPVIIELSKKGR